MQIEQNTHEETPPAQVGQRIMRATGALMLIQVVMKFFGLIEKMILGHLFGTSFITDAYSQARDIAFYVFQMVDQVVMHSFLPVFVQNIREKGEKDAWRLASTAINLLIILMAVVAVTGVFFMPDMLHFFVPGWYTGNPKQNPELIPLTIQLARMMLVAVVFMATTSLTYCLLNSYKKFALPAAADIVLKGTVLVFAIFFAGAWGPYALALGFIIGAVGKLAVHAFGLRAQLVNYQPVLDLKNPGLKKFGLLAAPLLVGVIGSIIRQMFDNGFTSSLNEGSMSALKFARQLCDMPVQFFPFAFGIALFPFLADIAVSGDKERLRTMLMTVTRMMIIIFVPLTALLWMLRIPIVMAVFGPKAMATVEPLQIYALGMLINALEIVVLQFFFAMSETLWPTIIGLVIIPFHIMVSWLGVYQWHLATVGIALALLISKSTKVVILYSLIRKRLGTLEVKKTLWTLAKVVVAMLPMLVILWLAVHYLPNPTKVTGSKLALIKAMSKFGVAGVIALAMYFIALYYAGVDEMSLLVAKVRGKLRR
ncbi:MAG: lipid II flippase MurJ [bacterium]